MRLLRNQSKKGTFAKSGKLVNITEYTETWSKGQLFPQVTITYVTEYEEDKLNEDLQQDEELVFGLSTFYGDEENEYVYDVNDDRPKSNPKLPSNITKGLQVRKTGFEVEYNRFGRRVQGFLYGSMESALNKVNDNDIVFINNEDIAKKYNLSKGSWYDIKLYVPIQTNERGQVGCDRHSI